MIQSFPNVVLSVCAVFSHIPCANTLIHTLKLRFRLVALQEQSLDYTVGEVTPHVSPWESLSATSTTAATMKLKLL